MNFAVNPKNHSEIYAGVVVGNIWTTTNNGTTMSYTSELVNNPFFKMEKHRPY